MPLNVKGKKILRNMKEEYGVEKGKRVFYASENSGKIKGVTKAGEVMKVALDQCDLAQLAFLEGFVTKCAARKVDPGLFIEIVKTAKDDDKKKDDKEESTGSKVKRTVKKTVSQMGEGAIRGAIPGAAFGGVSGLVGGLRRGIPLSAILSALVGTGAGAVTGAGIGGMVRPMVAE